MTLASLTFWSLQADPVLLSQLHTVASLSLHAGIPRDTCLALAAFPYHTEYVGIYAISFESVLFETQDTTAAKIHFSNNLYRECLLILNSSAVKHNIENIENDSAISLGNLQ